MCMDLQKAKEDLKNTPASVRTDIISILKVVSNQCVSQPDLTHALSDKYTMESIQQGVEDLKTTGFISADNCKDGYILHLNDDYQIRAKEYIQRRLREAV